MRQIVPRSMAPNAPENTDFPANVELNHGACCKFDQRTYTCSCGLTEHLLKIGAFVRYDAMCQATNRTKSDFAPLTEMLDEFLAELKARCRAVGDTTESED